MIIFPSFLWVSLSSCYFQKQEEISSSALNSHVKEEIISEAPIWEIWNVPKTHIHQGQKTAKAFHLDMGLPFFPVPQVL